MACTGPLAPTCKPRDARIGNPSVPFQTTAAPGASPLSVSESYDWDCNGTVELEHPEVHVSSDCAAANQAAAKGCLGRSQATCTATPGGYAHCPPNLLTTCGQDIRAYNCQWVTGTVPYCIVSGAAPTTLKMGCR